MIFQHNPTENPNQNSQEQHQAIADIDLYILYLDYLLTYFSKIYFNFRRAMIKNHYFLILVEIWVIKYDSSLSQLL